MTLLISKSALQEELFEAYKKSMDAGSQPGASPDDIIINLSNDVAFALNKYFVTAKVSTDVTIDKGQPDTGGGISDNEGSGEGVGTIVTQENVSKIIGNESGNIIKYLGEGRFQVDFKESDLQAITDIEIKLKTE